MLRRTARFVAYVTLQLKDDTARCEEEEAEKKVKLKAMREHHHKWEDTREGRVGTWRDFVKGKKTRVRLIQLVALLCGFCIFTLLCPRGLFQQQNACSVLKLLGVGIVLSLRQ